jgi:uncharacterized protein YrrD
MLKGAVLLGKPVLAYNTNREIGHVQGTLVDYDVNSLVAFWVTSRLRRQVLPWSGVKTVEPDRIIAWSVTMLANEQDLFSIRQLIDRKTIRPGMRFETPDHRDLGAMVDFYVNERTGRLEGFEVAGGLFGEAADGYGFLPDVRILSITDDAVLVPSSIIQVMGEKPGG